MSSSSTTVSGSVAVPAAAVDATLASSSLRAKVIAAIVKQQIPIEMANTLDEKLALSFPSATAYTSAYRTLMSLLTPKHDALKADTTVGIVPALKSGTPLPSDFANVRVDLLSSKLSIGKLLNNIQHIEKNKRSALASLPVLADPQQYLDDAAAKASKARAVGLIMARLHAAKVRVTATELIGDGTTTDVADVNEIADASMNLYYVGAPNMQYIDQALKNYTRVESMSVEYLHANPSFYIKRSMIHIIKEDFSAAIADLKILATRAQIASPAASSSSSSSSSASSSTYASLVAPRISTIASYVHTVSKQISTRCGYTEGELRAMSRDLPNPSSMQTKKEMTLIPSLSIGANSEKGVVLRVLNKVDRTSLYSLQSNSNADGTLLPFASIHDSIESVYRTPSSYIVVDSDGHAACLSLYNVLGDATKQKHIKKGDFLICFEPVLRQVAVEEGERTGSYRSIHAYNPLAVYIGFNLYDSSDVAHDIDN